MAAVENNLDGMIASFGVLRLAWRLRGPVVSLDFLFLSTPTANRPPTIAQRYIHVHMDLHRDVGLTRIDGHSNITAAESAHAGSCSQLECAQTSMRWATRGRVLPSRWSPIGGGPRAWRESCVWTGVQDRH